MILVDNAWWMWLGDSRVVEGLLSAGQGGVIQVILEQITISWVVFVDVFTA